jgi:hypothetical protein
MSAKKEGKAVKARRMSAPPFAPALDPLDCDDGRPQPKKQAAAQALRTPASAASAAPFDAPTAPFPSSSSSSGGGDVAIFDAAVHHTASRHLAAAPKEPPTNPKSTSKSARKTKPADDGRPVAKRTSTRASATPLEAAYAKIGVPADWNDATAVTLPAADTSAGGAAASNSMPEDLPSPKWDSLLTTFATNAATAFARGSLPANWGFFSSFEAYPHPVPRDDERLFYAALDKLCRKGLTFKRYEEHDVKFLTQFALVFLNIRFCPETIASADRAKWVCSVVKDLKKEAKIFLLYGYIAWMYFMRACTVHTGRVHLEERTGFYQVDVVVDMLLNESDLDIMAKSEDMRRASKILTDAFTSVFEKTPKFLRADIPSSTMFAPIASDNLHGAVLTLCAAAKYKLRVRKCGDYNTTFSHTYILNYIDDYTTNVAAVARACANHPYKQCMDFRGILLSCNSDAALHD